MRMPLGFGCGNRLTPQELLKLYLVVGNWVEEENLWPFCVPFRIPWEGAVTCGMLGASCPPSKKEWIKSALWIHSGSPAWSGCRTAAGKPLPAFLASPDPRLPH